MASPSHPDISPDLIAFAEKLADTARGIARGYFRSGVAIDDKADESPVTIADRNAEEAMRALIMERYPDHGIVGEEFGSHKPGSDWSWVLDPIDGTGAFIIGMPLFGVLISLAYEGRPVLGVIDAPALGERWVGAVGQPTAFNGNPCSTGAITSLADATMHTTAPEMFAGDDAQRLDQLRAATKRLRYGGDCYQYGLLALGGVDLVIESGMKTHDFMALAPVVEGAGGVFSDWAGAPVTIESGGKVLAAANRDLHEQVLPLLQ